MVCSNLRYVCVVNLGDVTIVPDNTLDVYRELLSAPTAEVSFNGSMCYTSMFKCVAIYYTSIVQYFNMDV